MSTYQSMPANVYDLGDTFEIACLIPGIDPQSIQVMALGNTITVAGDLQLSALEGASTVWEEFCPTQFRRQIGLPVEVDPNMIEATSTNGVLLVTAPTAETPGRARSGSRYNGEILIGLSGSR